MLYLGGQGTVLQGPSCSVGLLAWSQNSPGKVLLVVVSVQVWRTILVPPPQLAEQADSGAEVQL